MRTAAVTAGGDGSDRCKVTDRRSEGGENGRSLLLLFRQVGCVRYGGGRKKNRRLPKKKRVLGSWQLLQFEPYTPYFRAGAPIFETHTMPLGTAVVVTIGVGQVWKEEAWHHLDLTLEGMG